MKVGQVADLPELRRGPLGPRRGPMKVAQLADLPGTGQVSNLPHDEGAEPGTEVGKSGSNS
jgi:hypothetical protein